MANQGHPPPPPPPPIVRPPGQFPGGQRPQPPPGFRFPGPPGPGGPGGPGPMHVHLPPKIIQQSSRIRDITPQKILTEAECRQKLTEFAAFSIRKVPALPGEKASWARAEVTEDRLDQAEIKKAIKKLGEKGKSVSEKRQALAQFQQGQVTALLDDLASKETDRNFEWSLVQIDRVERLVPSSKPGKKAVETTVMNLYVKRAPVPGLNAVLMYQNIEKRRLDSLRPPPPPPPQQQQPPPLPPQEFRPPSGHGMRPPSAHGAKMPDGQPLFVEIGKGRPKSPRDKRKGRRYHERDGSSSGSSDSYDSESDSMSDASSSLDTSISSRSGQRPRRHSKATRSHSRHRPKYILEERRMSPDPRHSEAYGVPHHAQPPQQHQQHPQHPQHPQQLQHQQQPQHPQIHQQNPPPRPYVPDVPRMVPAIDPITSAYQAGKEDARAELGERIHSPVPPQPVVIERIIERPPLERVIQRPAIEHIVEAPRHDVSYTRLPERPRFAEHRYLDQRYVDEVGRDDDYLIRQREAEDHAILREREHRMRRDAEDYMDRRPSLDRPEFIGRRPSYSIRGDSSPSLSPTREFFDRRPSEFREREFRRPEVRRVFTTPVTPHPFAPVPRRYPPSTVSSGYTDPGW